MSKIQILRTKSAIYVRSCDIHCNFVCIKPLDQKLKSFVVKMLLALENKVLVFLSRFFLFLSLPRTVRLKTIFFSVIAVMDIAAFIRECSTVCWFTCSPHSIVLFNFSALKAIETHLCFKVMVSCVQTVFCYL